MSLYKNSLLQIRWCIIIEVKTIKRMNEKMPSTFFWRGNLNLARGWKLLIKFIKNQLTIFP